MAATTDPTRRTHPLAYALAGGLVVGTLDVVFAVTFWAWTADLPALHVLQTVAAGLLGPAAFGGGYATAALGFTLHYFIALSVAVVYYAAARRWAVLWEQASTCGALYGLLLYAVMNHVVVPLSRASPPPANPLWFGLNVGVHVLLIGLPIALFVRQGLLQWGETGPNVRRNV